MGLVKRFEDLDCWKEGAKLACDVFTVAEKDGLSRNFALRDQICRSALSIPSNIAEGFERDSTNVLTNALRIAKGSAGELRTQLYIAAKLGYIDRRKAADLISKSRRLSKMLARFIQSLDGNR